MRNNDIDSVRALAIIMVALYHLGILTYGYLGVDVFFVISGYFFFRELIRGLDDPQYSCLQMIKERLLRFWPAILCICAVSLIFGLFFMLPDDFESVAQSVIASSVFANNILACITTKNYWDVANVFKPLMHTWYIAVLMQSFVCVGFLAFLTRKLTHCSRRGLFTLTWMLTIGSIVLYLIPSFSSAQKFYYVPFRLWEITLGGLIAFYIKPDEKGCRMAKWLQAIKCIAIGLMAVLMIWQQSIMQANIRLMTTTAAAAVFLISSLITNEQQSRVSSAFSHIGRASYSIYLWHQVFVSILYYSIVQTLTIASFMGYVVATGVVSFISYRVFEAGPMSHVRKKETAKHILVGCLAVLVMICSVSGVIYLRAGVVRDIPELGIESNEVHRGMHAEYCDRPYQWRNPFCQDDRTKVLVIGNSFARDWCNILAESEYSSQLDISYLYVDMYATKDTLTDFDHERVSQADVVFFAMYYVYDDVPAYLQDVVPAEKLYVVGDKSYGSSNGIYYAHRWDIDYYEQTTSIDPEYFYRNHMMREKYGDHYVDLLAPVSNSENRISVFTDDEKFISQDCRHLTKYGAEYYARILDFAWLKNVR